MPGQNLGGDMIEMIQSNHNTAIKITNATSKVASNFYHDEEMDC